MFANADLQGETSELTFTLTFTVEGEYVIGVRTVRTTPIGVVYSEINWSDVNGVSTPDPFVVRYIVPIPEPEGLRLQ